MNAATLTPLVFALLAGYCPVAASGAEGAHRAEFPIADHVVAVPAPAGMVSAPALVQTRAFTFRKLGSTSMVLVAVFVVDSAAVSPGVPQPPSAAYVGAARERVSVESGRANIRDQQRRNRALSGPGGSAADALGRRARALVEQDPEGRAGFAIPIPSGSRVTLASIAMDSRAAGTVTAAPVPPAAGEGARAPVVLSGQATVVAQGEVLGLYEQRFAGATTRSVAAFRDEFSAWVRAVLAQEPPQVEVKPPPSREPLSEDDELFVVATPEATRKVPPQYPDSARRAGVEGTVLVQALVGHDGLAHDAKIVRSVPGLDAAALAAVRQWLFKPAMFRGKPIAVWVAVPVKFSLH